MDCDFIHLIRVIAEPDTLIWFKILFVHKFNQSERYPDEHGHISSQTNIDFHDTVTMEFLLFM